MSEIIYGDAGFFAIPDAGVWLPVYDKAKHKARSQAVVDAEHSGILCRQWRGGQCDYVADHAGQGFDKIKRCTVGTMAVIQTPAETQWYVCVGVLQGTNTGTALTTVTGQELRQVRWADLCAYCCDDAAGKRITMVFFKKGMRENRPTFREWYI